MINVAVDNSINQAVHRVTAEKHTPIYIYIRWARVLIYLNLWFYVGSTVNYHLKTPNQL